MNEAKILSKRDVNKVIERCLKDAQVIAPVRTSTGDTIFAAVASPSEISLDERGSNSIISPRECFFPQQETILSYRSGKDGYELEPRLQDGKRRIIFGLRSCDVSAILFLDRFFGGGIEDLYYVKKRKDTTLVSLGCNDPAETCFCICAECGPFLTFGFDLQLVGLDDRYFVEIGTEKGQRIVEDNQHLFTPCSVADVKKRFEVVESAKSRFRTPKAYFSKTIRRLSEEKYDKRVWGELGKRCFSCGGCSYVCPTCSCFDVADIPRSNGEWDRLRTWDSCMFAGFTKEASGHNPRPEKKDRVQRRFFHKLSYECVKKNAAHGCVGCGRCIIACLGNINMPVAVERIRRTE